jgi:hypothetical protein
LDHIVLEDGVESYNEIYQFLRAERWHLCGRFLYIDMLYRTIMTLYDYDYGLVGGLLFFAVKSLHPYLRKIWNISSNFPVSHSLITEKLSKKKDIIYINIWQRL